MLNIPQSLVLKWNKDYPILFISLLEFVRLPNFVNCVLFFNLLELLHLFRLSFTCHQLTTG